MLPSDLMDQGQNFPVAAVIELQRILSNAAATRLSPKFLVKFQQALEGRAAPVVNGLANIAHHPKRLGLVGELAK